MGRGCPAERATRRSRVPGLPRGALVPPARVWPLPLPFSLYSPAAPLTLPHSRTPGLLAGGALLPAGACVPIPSRRRGFREAARKCRAIFDEMGGA